MNWIASYFLKHQKYSYPDWTSIGQYIEGHYAPEDSDKIWEQVIDIWTSTLAKEFHYQKSQTSNFIIIHNAEQDFIDSYSLFLERCLSKILTSLDNIAYKYSNEKLIILLVDSQDDYYEYISHFYPDGEFGLSGGLFYKLGLGHFIIPHQELWMLESITSHEMTHAVLNHLQLPVWIDEGLATNIESAITGHPLDTSPEQTNKHIAYWNSQNIQDFWSGKSFSNTDDGQNLSYHLAEFIIRSLARSYHAFANFCNEAHYEDAGQSAFLENFDMNLSELMTPLLGSGQWEPKPELWEQ